MALRKVKVQAPSVPAVEELEEAPVVEEPQEEAVPTGAAKVTVHEDRRDSGTNWRESPKLPSLDD